MIITIGYTTKNLQNIVNDYRGQIPSRIGAKSSLAAVARALGLLLKAIVRALCDIGDETAGIRVQERIEKSHGRHTPFESAGV